MNITKEVREFLIWEFGNKNRPQDAADYIYNQFCDDWPDMSKATNSKFIKDLVAAFQWWDIRYDANITRDFIKALKEHGVEVTA